MQPWAGGRPAGVPRSGEESAVRVPGAVPALVNAATFATIQRSLSSRSPSVTPPRRVSSPYLLSCLLHCGKCGAAMFGMGAKSWSFHYYVCSTAFRSGREACSEQAVPQAKIEAVILKGLQEHVLNQDNIADLVHLTNEELASAIVDTRQHLSSIDGQIDDVNQRLVRLYDAIETASVTAADLGPHIQKLRQRHDLLLRSKAELTDAVQDSKATLIDRDQVLGYLDRFQETLSAATFEERRKFLRSFVETIVKDGTNLELRYTLPLPPTRVNLERERVLELVQDGGRYWIRTSGLRDVTATL